MSDRNDLDQDPVDDRTPDVDTTGDSDVVTLPNDVEKRMEAAFLEDRRTTTRLGWTAVWSWTAATMMLTGGGLMAMLARQQSNEGLRLAFVAASVPAMSLLLVGVVTTFLWSRRSQRITLETLQARLERIESMLRND